jgi:hypothetical protein
VIDDRLDRRFLDVTSREQAEADDVDYWMSKTPTERIEALEYLRRWVYGDDAVDARVESVLVASAIEDDEQDVPRLPNPAALHERPESPDVEK